MAEAIAALAFAGNVVQFLDFGAKFVLKADELIKAGRDDLSKLKELRHITDFLHPLLQQLNADASSNQVSIQSPSQLRLVDLSRECSQVVEELLQTLDDVGLNGTGRKRDAIVASFQLTWKGPKIEKLHKRIVQLRSELAVELLNSIREHTSQSLQTQEAILQQLKNDSRYSPPKPGKKITQGLMKDLDDAPGTIMLQYIRSTLASGTADEQMTQIEDSIHRLVLQQRDEGVDDDNNLGPNYSKIEMEQSRKEKIEARIISSLRYSQIALREAAVADAYRETFQWMFEDSPPDRRGTRFREWLESSDRLYWITGKAGSGKSTLMKFISNFDGASEGSLKCEEHLQKWAGGRDHLVVASFYFWASGSSIEASQRGLFQSLLCQILEGYPDLLPEVIPKTWEAWYSFGLENKIESEKILEQILLDTIRELVEQRHKKVCLFIDGLDEYRGDQAIADDDCDDHEMLIKVLRSFLNLPNVKMCVSSRPWIVFEDNFGTEPNLMLQEFTYPDIEHYVTSRFNENSGFTRLKLREPEFARTLMTNITDKASGVFLWIKLVVISLLAGLTNDDRIADLQRRLNRLPPDLERLYGAILDDLDPFYFSHASQYFQLLEASNDDIDALLYSFSDEEENVEFALRLPIRAFERGEIQARRDTVKRRLNSRCKGLLEVEVHGRVRFLHLSVKDYIDTNEIRSRIDSAAAEDFDCHLQLCSANLAMVKITNGCPDSERIRFAQNCLMSAAKVKQDVSKMIQILDDLHRTLIEVLTPPGLKSFYRSMPSVPGYGPPTFHPTFGTSFLATTVRFSVVDYVRARAKTGCMASDDNKEHDKVETYPVDPELVTKPSRFRRLHHQENRELGFGGPGRF
ncbi:hypothetical protein E8E14_007220 [Neopestalotiopsis sp. 37M]|nr:hypothetical protein E8E14_007220 [Neopestalotiopsis sp. 37M]